MLLNIYNIKFPKLGLDFRINSEAFKIAGITIHWYGIILCVGFLLSIWYVLSNCKRFSVDSNAMSDVIACGIFCGIIGARLYYVIFYPGDDYIKNPIQILYINQGGIAIYGGIIFGILGGLFWAKRKNIRLSAALDLSALGLLIGQSVGRWGNFVNQEAFGTPTDIFCGMVSENTYGIAVHPCFLYESLWCAFGFILLHWFSLRSQKYSGQLFLLYVVWYGTERFFVEGLRTDSLIIPGMSLRISQAIALISVLISLVLLVKFKAKNKVSNII